jgi:hypothetical protein
VSGYRVIPPPPPVDVEERAARVRVISVNPRAYSGEGAQYVGMTGRITGTSGQFVVVQLEYDKVGNRRGEGRALLFLPAELTTIRAAS